MVKDPRKEKQNHGKHFPDCPLFLSVFGPIKTQTHLSVSSSQTNNMSYLLRLWMSATAAAPEHKTRRSSGQSEEEDRADESLRKVMYFTCWGQG
ncbi:hypothetical protein Fmac_021703 [Flemingia macrophylla]|uniref:Uncharacterized protein n=1 Tax=Flemingia macrophylla TaxID=520843 RepID=A0ABD1LXR3_9FABA